MSVGLELSAWELHPALVHFPIAFLLGGVALDVFAWWSRKLELAQIATALFIAGVAAGILAALAGILAFYTLPAQTHETRVLLYWHLGLETAAVLLFSWPALVRWREWTWPPTFTSRIIGLIAAVLLVTGSYLGGYLVYHGGVV